MVGLLYLRDHDPRTADTSVVRLATYNGWFAVPQGDGQAQEKGYPKGMPNYIKKLKNKNCVCTFPGPVFCIIVSAWTCMIMEFQLVDGVQFFLVLSVLVALPPLW